MAQRRVKYEGNKGQGEEWRRRAPTGAARNRCRAPTDAGRQQIPGANKCRATTDAVEESNLSNDDTKKMGRKGRYVTDAEER